MGRSKAALAIRFGYHGCANRPFFHIQLQKKRQDRAGPVIEQLGVYDPMPNINNERLVSINFDRVRHWLGQNKTVEITPAVQQLFGLVGFFPVHPRSYIQAWRNRREQETAKQEAESGEVKG
ncbi:probable 28S ribosomal protein S16, mitochondrial [Amphibalanus amphitrite]|uniref:probable 28S ribosomal protein S16, mitochondrial n=1 Tax=Amphibalanus amphitrite TaxID=1232801 RepID=UPI001C908078|nr:probable 28S ribosomal protein S16, mitochondrial [Amphibalanus amphitrite]XP_043233819.1 probable 28S ribosomal protein S16, mitochondrial [Amphibalanus amphitrite]